MNASAPRSDRPAVGAATSRWRTRRRWWSIAVGVALLPAFAGALELHDWARDEGIGWLDFLFSPGLVLWLLVWNVVDRWRVARRLGGSDQRRLYERALRDGFLPGDDIGDLHRWRAELTRGADNDGPALLIGVGVGGLIVACWYLWPDDPTTSSVLLLASVLLAIAVVVAVVVARDARPRPPEEPGRLVQAIDLRIAAAARDDPDRRD